MNQDEERINEKIREIEKYLDEIDSILPVDYDYYIGDFKIRAIFERYFEKIIEAVVDLAFLVIKFCKLKTPEDEENAFKILYNEKVISEFLLKKLIAAKGMRNIIAHEYGKVDDTLVYNSVTLELEEDVEEFIKNINDYLNNKRKPSE